MPLTALVQFIEPGEVLSMDRNNVGASSDGDVHDIMRKGKKCAKDTRPRFWVVETCDTKGGKPKKVAELVFYIWDGERILLKKTVKARCSANNVLKNKWETMEDVKSDLVQKMNKITVHEEVTGRCLKNLLC